MANVLETLFGNKQKANTLQKFPRILATADWITADAVCQPSQWNKIGQLTVPAQQEITFGANDPNGLGAGRTVYLRVDEAVGAGTQIHGKVRFALTNANETKTVVVLEESTRKLSADQNDRTKAVLLPEYGLRAKEDSKLQILLYPDGASAKTVDYDGTNTLYLIPVTVYQ